MAEIGLVLLLFTDASRTDLKILRNIRELPARLLSIGMLLTILLGALAAKLVFPQLSLWEAGILSAILAPTDAGLGQIIVNSPLVPMRVRQALNVEAGLNDGLSVPFLLFFIAMAAAGTGEAELRPLHRRATRPRHLGGRGHRLGRRLAAGQPRGVQTGWRSPSCSSRWWRCRCSASWSPNTVGASMFIAAFVAGLFVQVPFKDAGKHSVEFTEEWGQILNLSVFFLFGMMVGRDHAEFGIAPFVYALLSLTIVRMLPVAVSLTGCGLDKATVAFMGWFGPRGLASIVLGLVYLEQEKHLPGEHITRLAVMATVLLSIFAHGLTRRSGHPPALPPLRHAEILPPPTPKHHELRR